LTYARLTQIPPHYLPNRTPRSVTKSLFIWPECRSWSHVYKVRVEAKPHGCQEVSHLIPARWMWVSKFSIIENNDTVLFHRIRDIRQISKHERYML
jgi:hypothetical protein